MTMYINTQTGNQVSEQQIRSDYPNTSFSTPFVAPTGYELVFPSPQPTHDPITQSVREITPTPTVKGHYEQRWEVVNLDTEQVAANQAAAYAASIPQVVTALQGLLALDVFKISQYYEVWANSPDRTFAERAFINKAQTWKRDDPILIGAATSLNLTDVQIDDLFKLAVTL